MPTTTPNLDLKLYDINDTTTRFIDYWQSINLNADGVQYTYSAFQKIDTAIGTINTTLANLVPVTANPTLVGTEASLTGLEVDGIKYVVSGGGSEFEVVELTGNSGTLSDEDFAKLSGNNCVIKTEDYILHKWYQDNTNIYYNQFNMNSSYPGGIVWQCKPLYIQISNKYWSKNFKELSAIFNPALTGTEEELEGLLIGNAWASGSNLAREKRKVLNSQQFATAYSSSATYAVGDMVSYRGKFYICKTAISTAEGFTSSKWIEAKPTVNIVNITSSDTYLSDDDFALISSDYCIIKASDGYYYKRDQSSSSIIYAHIRPNYQQSGSGGYNQFRYADISVSNKRCVFYDFNIPSVFANLNLSGTEAGLNSLTIGAVKYRVTGLSFTNISASSWTADNTYADYGYKCDLTCSGITANSVVDVIFDVAEATSGKYAPVCATSSNTVTIYSKVNTTITIPLIKEII